MNEYEVYFSSGNSYVVKADSEEEAMRKVYDTDEDGNPSLVMGVSKRQ